MAIDDMTTSTHFARMVGNKFDWTFGAADGAQSRLAPNGATYWCWGDTILGYPGTVAGSFDSGRFMVSNSILCQRGAELYPATTANGTAAVPDVVMNGVLRRFWVTDILFPTLMPGKAFALCQRIHDDGGFITDGAMIAEFAMTGDKLDFVQMWQTPSVLDALETSEIQWAQSWEEFGGYVYVYGYKQIVGAVGGYFTPHRTYVARVPTRWLLNPSAWQFWTGTGWIAGATATGLLGAKAKAGIILDGMLTSVRYDYTNGRWLFAHKPWNGIGTDVKILSAAVPQGPLVLKQSINSPGGTSPGGNAYFTYNATLHPQVDLVSGKTLMSISHNGDFAAIFAERSLYKPEFQEVTIPL